MSRPNFFHLLEIKDYTLNNDAEIQKRIAMKQAEWSKNRNNPSRAHESKENLSLINEIKEVLLNHESREEEANEARLIDEEIRVTEERERYRKLDELLNVLSQKGWILHAEVEQMSTYFNLTKEEIESRIAIPVKTEEIEPTMQNEEKVNLSEVNKIAQDCEFLGISTIHISNVPSLYDFLQVSPTTSVPELIKTAEEKYEVLRRSGTSAKNDVAKNLQGQSVAIFKNRREKYDYALSQLRLSKVKEFFEIATVSNVVQESVAKALQNLASSYGSLSKADAAEYVEQYCRMNNIKIVSNKPKDKETNLRQCGMCGLLNLEKNKFCTNCNTQLVIPCPICNHKVNSVDHSCGRCDFAIGNMANVPTILKHAKQARFRKELDIAKMYAEEVLEIWPKHPGASELLQSIQRDIHNNEKFLSEMNQLIQKKYFYTVRKLFIKEKAFVNCSRSLQSLEKESLHHIHQAENYCKRAEKSPDDSVKMENYLLAIDAAADCDKAAQFLSKTPPLPPTSLQATTSTKGIALKWQESLSKGTITYRVLRKVGEESKHFRDGEIINESSSISFVDENAIGGIPYYYNIYALRGSIVSKECISAGPFIRNAEVDYIKVIPGDQSIELNWLKPEGAIDVEVWKKEGSIPAHREDGQLLSLETAEKVIDRDVVTNREYGYLIVAVYKVNGNKVYSKGLTRISKLAISSQTLESIEVTRKDDGILLQWEISEAAEQFMFYYAYKPFTEADEKTLAKGNQLESRQIVDQLHHKNEVLLQVNMSGIVYILPVIHKNGTIIIGDMITSRSLPEVSSITHRVNNDLAFLEWNWPSNIEEVAIVINEHHFIKSLHASKDDYVTLTKDVYNQKGYYELSMKERDYYVTIFTKIKSSDGVSYSNGHHYLIVRTNTLNLTYEIRQKGMFSKRNTLHISAESVTWIPDLILVMNESNVPTNKHQGEIILNIRSQKIYNEEVFNLSKKHLQENMYAKLFFDNDEDAKKIRLQTPKGKDSMKLW